MSSIPTWHSAADTPPRTGPSQKIHSRVNRELVVRTKACNNSNNISYSSNSSVLADLSQRQGGVEGASVRGEGGCVGHAHTQGGGELGRVLPRPLHTVWRV